MGGMLFSLAFCASLKAELGVFIIPIGVQSGVYLGKVPMVIFEKKKLGSRNGIQTNFRKTSDVLLL
ncbi:uncharacterized protein CLUP02_04102 [Colletotrichum lupini]|uniref:Uncharacterized protein n=1 Tax=Colletotrichum lupini TaxID=145971 RepID=A0A9Q8SKK7_9PEZI|nr:uncharacterized protein CLUP02_04102 [Colletotrichum lupini]UQC78625.1 hypothetical protein CLUP02_04102 [Colletotrichum lupini]